MSGTNNLRSQKQLQEEIEIKFLGFKMHIKNPSIRAIYLVILILAFLTFVLSILNG